MNYKVFGTLFFSLLATITGVGIVVPLLPVYARHAGASGLYVGLIFGAFSLSRTFLLPFFGRWSDHSGRKPFILIGLISYALVSVAFICFSQVTQLIIIRLFQGVASAMIMPVVQAYVGDITPKGKEGYVMGLFNMSLFFGLSMGPVIGGIINDHASLQAAFVCMGALALAGSGLTFFFLPATREEAVFRKNRPPMAWREIIGDRTIIGLFVLRMTYTAGISIIWGFLPILGDAEFDLSSSQIGFLVMLGVLVSGAIQAPMGYLADRINCKVMVTVGSLLAGVAVFSFRWAFSFSHLFAGSLAFGLGGGIAMPALMAMAVLKGNQTASMGSVMSLLTMAHSLGMLIGAVLAGLMMDFFQLRVAFSFGFIFILAGLAVFSVFVSSRQIGALKQI